MKLSEISYVCPVPDTLKLPTLVYKYRTNNNFLIPSLENNQLWLAEPRTFNDPFEPERLFSGSPFSQALDRSIRAAGVFCLCKSRENLPMWSYYGDGLRGLVLGYDLATLLSSIKPLAPTNNECGERWKYVFDLDYRDDDLMEVDEMALLNNDSLTDIERQKMFATKSRAFEHEEECRIVVQPSADRTQEFAWHGHGDYLHSPDALREVIFGELMPEDIRQTIKEILKGRNIQFMKAVRNRQSFRINVVDMPPP